MRYIVTKIEQIKAQLSLHHVLDTFGAEGIRRNQCRCFLPGHDDKAPSMQLYWDKDRAWCFGCNRGGDVLDLTAIMLNTDIKGAIEFWERRLGLSFSEDKTDWEAVRMRKEERALRDYACYWRVAVERDIPKPLNPDLWSIWGYIWGEKDRLEELLDRPLEYIREMWKWLFWANDVLNTVLRGVRV